MMLWSLALSRVHWSDHSDGAERPVWPIDVRSSPQLTSGQAPDRADRSADRWGRLTRSGGQLANEHARCRPELQSRRLIRWSITCWERDPSAEEPILLLHPSLLHHPHLPLHLFSSTSIFNSDFSSSFFFYSSSFSSSPSCILLFCRLYLFIFFSSFLLFHFLSSSSFIILWSSSSPVPLLFLLSLSVFSSSSSHPVVCCFNLFLFLFHFLPSPPHPLLDVIKTCYFPPSTPSLPLFS